MGENAGSENASENYSGSKNAIKNSKQIAT
jgi:hypothetical protein